MKKIFSFIFSVLIISSLFISCGSVENNSTRKSNLKAISDLTIKNNIIEMDGEKKEDSQNQHGIAYFDSEMTDELLLQFYNEVVINSGLQYISLIDKKNKELGFVFSPFKLTFYFGKINAENGSLIESMKEGIISDNRESIQITDVKN